MNMLKKTIISLAVFGVLGTVSLGTAIGATPQVFLQASDRLVESARIAAGNEEHDDAIQLFERAMVANPANIPAYVGLGGVYVERGSYAKGIKYYDIALSIDQVDLTALEGRALAYLKSQDLESARESFRTIQQVCEISACEALIRVGEALEEYQAERQ